jgi:hypothetical protein
MIEQHEFNTVVDMTKEPTTNKTTPLMWVGRIFMTLLSYGTIAFLCALAIAGIGLLIKVAVAAFKFGWNLI